MQLLREHSEIIPQPSVATIGFFDGVHRGHRFLIEQVRDVAAERGLCSSVVTFPVHPYKVMHPEFSPELLTTCDEKISLLDETGLDYCVMLNFTTDLAKLSAREFMTLLKERYNIRALVIGYDHRFGHNRSEGFDDYVRHGKELGIEVLLARAYIYNDEAAVSSSVIRQLLLSGNVSEAAKYLGYEFFLDGTVVNGHRIGRKLGFPTANIQVSETDKLIPSDGIYAVRVKVRGELYKGMLSIGYRPTVNNGTDRSIEVNIFHFDSDIYGEAIRVYFVCYTRPELKFDTIEELTEQLHEDEKEIKLILHNRLHDPMQ